MMANDEMKEIFDYAAHNVTMVVIGAKSYAEQLSAISMSLECTLGPLLLVGHDLFDIWDRCNAREAPTVLLARYRAALADLQAEPRRKK